MDLIAYLLGKSKGGGGGEEPTGTITITENGTYNVKSYASAEVNTPSPRDWSQIGYTNEPSYIGAGFTRAKYIKDNWDATVVDGSRKFASDQDLVFIPLVDTSNMSDMSWFCQNSHLLQKFPALDTSNATNMRYFFNGCASLREIDFTNFDTSNCTDMHNMFFACYCLLNITIPFNTSKVTTMSSMFQRCWNTEELDLSSFTDEALTTVESMFYDCRELKKLDIRGFTFTNNPTYSSMFGTSASNGPTNDCLIIVKDTAQKTWITSRFSRLTNVKTVAEYEASLN